MPVTGELLYWGHIDAGGRGAMDSTGAGGIEGVSGEGIDATGVAGGPVVTLMPVKGGTVVAWQRCCIVAGGPAAWQRCQWASGGIYASSRGAMGARDASGRAAMGGTGTSGRGIWVAGEPVGGRGAGSARELMLDHLARVRARVWVGEP